MRAVQRFLSIVIMLILPLWARAQNQPLGTGKLDKGLVIEVTELKRTSDNFLKVSYQIRNPTQANVTYTISGAYFVPESYYIEAGGKLKYPVVKDDRGNPLAAQVPGTLNLAAGEKVEYWIKFAGPRKGVKNITVYFRKAEPIEDIPLPPDPKAADEDAKPPAAAVKALGSGKLPKGLVIDVMEVNRTSDNFLKVSFRIRNPTDARVTYTISGVYFVPESYYVEAGGKFKYLVVKDDKGNPVASHVPGTLALAPGEQVEYWIKFAAPMKGVKQITLYFRQAEPIEDIPVPPADSK